MAALCCLLKSWMTWFLSPEGEVTVAVRYAGLNYKDGLCLNGKGGPDSSFRGFRVLNSLARFWTAAIRATRQGIR